MKGSNFRNVFSPSFIIYSLILAVCLVVPSPVLAADSDAHQGHGVSHAAMGMVDNSNEPWAQQLKGQTIVRKLVLWATNKGQESGARSQESADFPAYVLHFTDYSPGRATPLERDIRVSNSREQIDKLWDELVKQNVVKGWVQAA